MFWFFLQLCLKHFSFKQEYIQLFLVCVCVCMVQQPKLGLDRLFLRFINHTQLDTSGRTSLHERSARRSGCYLHSTQQTQETNIHVLSGIRTRNPSSRAAADLRLPPGSVNDIFIDLTIIAVVIGQWSERPRNSGSISGSGETFIFAVTSRQAAKTHPALSSFVPPFFSLVYGRRLPEYNTYL